MRRGVAVGVLLALVAPSVAFLGGSVTAMTADETPPAKWIAGKWTGNVQRGQTTVANGTSATVAEVDVDFEFFITQAGDVRPADTAITIPNRAVELSGGEMTGTLEMSFSELQMAGGRDEVFMAGNATLAGAMSTQGLENVPIRNTTPFSWELHPTQVTCTSASGTFSGPPSSSVMGTVDFAFTALRTPGSSPGEEGPTEILDLKEQLEAAKAAGDWAGAQQLLAELLVVLEGYSAHVADVDGRCRASATASGRAAFHDWLEVLVQSILEQLFAQQVNVDSLSAIELISWLTLGMQSGALSGQSANPEMAARFRELFDAAISQRALDVSESSPREARSLCIGAMQYGLPVTSDICQSSGIV